MDKKIYYLFVNGGSQEEYSDPVFAMGAALHEVQKGNRVEVMTREQWLEISDKYEEHFTDVMNFFKECSYNLTNDNWNKMCRLVKEI